MASNSTLVQFHNLLSSTDFLFIVVYRGHWCPFCRSYLTTLQSLTSSIVAAGGTPIILTAEPEVHLPETRKSTGYSGKAIVDPDHVLVKYFKSKGFVDVAITEKDGYEHGMAQPAILVLKKDETVLESWAIVPSLMNIGGAKDRPDLKQVWENVQAKVKGHEAVHQKYKLEGFWVWAWGKFFGRG